MNEEQLIDKENENTNEFWDDNLELKSGITLNMMSTSNLSDYLDILDVTLNDKVNKTEINYPKNKSNDPQDWIEGRYAEDKDINEYLQYNFGFILMDFNNLSIIKDRKDYNMYFDRIDIDVWIRSISNSASHMAEAKLNDNEW